MRSVLNAKSATGSNSLRYIYKKMKTTYNNVFIFFIFSVDEKEKEEMLKELRDAMIQNCLMTENIKAANEIKDQLPCTDKIENSQNVEKIKDVSSLILK